MRIDRWISDAGATYALVIASLAAERDHGR
jgi:hypothetical protein